MRITGGIYGGRHLAAPGDMSVRPTSDRTRQAIFNMLAHKDFGIGFSLEGAAVLDLFAGTGALGIEALSHGARLCLFVDDSADSRALAAGKCRGAGPDRGDAHLAARRHRSGPARAGGGRTVRSGVSRSALSQGA